MEGAILLTSLTPRDVAEQLVDILAERGLLPRSAPVSPYMDVSTCAAYMCASKQRVYDLISQGALVPHRDGRRVLLARQDVDRYLANNA